MAMAAYIIEELSGFPNRRRSELLLRITSQRNA